MKKFFDIKDKERLKAIVTNPGFYALAICLVALFWLVLVMIQLGLFSLSTIMAVVGAGLLVMALCILPFYLLTNWRTKVVAWLVCIGAVLLCYLSAGSLSTIVRAFQSVTVSKQSLSESVGVYAYKQVPVNSLEDLNTMTVGVLAGGNSLLKETIQKDLESQGISPKYQSYDNLQQLVKALKGQAVRAIVLADYQLELVEEFAGLEDMGDKLYLLYGTASQSEVSFAASRKDLSSEPYTVLVSTTLNSVEDPSYRSYLNMLFAINPQTRQVLSVTIPRNYWVQTVCSEQLACSNAQDKLSFASYHTVQTLKSTLENLLETTIDYTVEVDLNTLVELADIAEPLLVENETEYSSGNYTYTIGTLEMNTSKARQFIRDLNDFSTADRSLESNTFHVLQAILSQVGQSEDSGTESFLKVVKSAVKTSFSYQDLVHMIQVFFMEDYHWQQTDMTLTGSDGWEYSPEMTAYTYVIYPDEQDVAVARKAIGAVLAGSKPDLSGRKAQTEASQETGQSQEETEEAQEESQEEMAEQETVTVQPEEDAAVDENADVQ